MSGSQGRRFTTSEVNSTTQLGTPYFSLVDPVEVMLTLPLALRDDIDLSRFFPFVPPALLESVRDFLLPFNSVLPDKTSS